MGYKLLFKCSFKVSYWSQWHNFPAHLSSMLQDYLLWAVCIICCSWGLIAVGSFVGSLNPFYWVNIGVNLYYLVWDALQVLPPNCFHQGLMPAGIPLGVPFVQIVELSSYVAWSPPLFVLVLSPLGYVSGIAVRHCLEIPCCLLLMSVSTGPKCAWDGSV